MSTGPITKDTSSLALGLAKIRVAASESFISLKRAALSGEAMSVGALANTKFVGQTDWYKHQSGFPMLDDYVIALRDSAAMECAAEEMTPYNFAMIMGIDPTTGAYGLAHSGEIDLGSRVSPAYLRMEAEYYFPNGTNKMVIVFPRAQVVSNAEFDLQKEEAANLPMVFESKRADNHVTYGSTWTACPLGIVVFT